MCPLFVGHLTATKHLRAYLDDAYQEHPDTHTFISNFMVPPLSWQGRILDNPEAPSHIPQLVSRLNDVKRDWVTEHRGTHEIDLDNLANIIGKRRLDESPIAIFSHRTPFDPYDDWIDGPNLPYPSVLPSYSVYSVYSNEPYCLILQELHYQMITLKQKDLVKLVVFDLDDTLWRGNTSDMRLGPWEGRPQSIIEAIKVLKSRGILVAISSNNDYSFISSQWANLTSSLADVPLSLPLRLDDFDDVQISFEPKPYHMTRIPEKFNLLPKSVVFVDDNPLHREAISAQYPTIRLLGPNLITSEKSCLTAHSCNNPSTLILVTRAPLVFRFANI
jgi:HAD superfamily phosphatase (TIGR01681 family)